MHHVDSDPAWNLFFEFAEYTHFGSVVEVQLLNDNLYLYVNNKRNLMWNPGRSKAVARIAGVANQYAAAIVFVQHCCVSENKLPHTETVAQSVIEWSIFGMIFFWIWQIHFVQKQINSIANKFRRPSIPITHWMYIVDTLTHSGVICWQIQVMPINRLNVTMVAHPVPHSIPVCFNGKDNNGDAKESIDARQSDTHIV